MISLPSSPKVIQKDKNKAIFQIEGLYPGYGTTIGNSLRRVLLSSLEGVAVTEVKIKGAAHEFSTIPGILEDVIMILLNLKNLRFKIHEGTVQKVNLLVKGEKKVTGGDFNIFPQIELANPKAPVATITDKKTELDIELTIEKGIGYEPRDQRKIKKAASGGGAHSEIGVIALDAIFTPIKNVNFQVESMRVGDRTDFDKLNIEIETDGTLTPEEAFDQSVQILIRHFALMSGSQAPELEKTEESVETEVLEPKTKEKKVKKETKKAKKK